jgi:hypothetical protein
LNGQRCRIERRQCAARPRQVPAATALPETLVAETLVVGWRCAMKACVVLMMPILCP